MKDFEASKEIGFDALFNGASIGIIITDEESRILQANSFLLNLFDYSAEEIIGKHVELLMPSRFREKHVHHRTDFQHHPRSRVMGAGLNLFGTRSDGTEFPVEVSLGPYTSGDRHYVIAFVSDISNRKAAEDNLKKLNAELEEKVEERTSSLNQIVLQLEEQMREIEEKDQELLIALDKEKQLNELKSRFVTLASHEFRTPLSAILSSTFLISKYAQSGDLQQQEKHLKKISASVNLLTDILNDFLSVGKIEEGRVEVRYVVFDICKYLSNIIEEMNNLVKHKQIVTYMHEGEAEIELDPSLLRHIITNLISNAIKFSPEESSILISTKYENGLLTLKVKDHGMGIPAEDQPQLFERFFRAANVSYIQGTGLGLHIIGKYVELMAGTITVESELGKGTTFIIEFSGQNRRAD
ncbi:PAS/PAC sensor signal transduction histidine kinase [Chitinophaga sp. YR573]|uniref:PAS domain-containing sensor histidine kinase n=1 Tax=Chitinophaga sp. YR573 TaxID=1881040 RepID=UPI0008BEDC47|nr:PAS domain-containing sensor histidine kinase [Chitinophaga sp. YR573]SEW39537.1 PAS/PAC sensor signal transduction histidine kinase [Chitinophaga sp. YR573]